MKQGKKGHSIPSLRPTLASKSKVTEPARRLNSILSSAGLTSRRRADEWIKAGRVSLKGRIVTELGTKAVWGRDRIQVDGKEIPGPVAPLYLMLNKPFGYISSLKDPEGRPVVTELLSGLPKRVYPVGRLDFDTMGLLLMTNDGQWAARLMHPRYRIPRTYKVTVAGHVSEENMDLLRGGVRLEDGTVARARGQVIGEAQGQTLLRMTINQGLNRQIRRMLETVGYRVIHLIRIGVGTLALGDLKVGEYRFLETQEVESLKGLVGLP